MDGRELARAKTPYEQKHSVQIQIGLTSFDVRVPHWAFLLNLN